MVDVCAGEMDGSTANIGRLYENLGCGGQSTVEQLGRGCSNIFHRETPKIILFNAPEILTLFCPGSKFSDN